MYAKRSLKNFNQIEKIQRIFTKRLFYRIYGDKPCPSYNDRLRLFSLSSMCEKLTKSDLIMLFKILSGSLYVDGFSPTFSARKQLRIVYSSFRTSLFRSSFFHSSCVNWNKYMCNLKSLPLSTISFKSLIKKVHIE